MSFNPRPLLVFTASHIRLTGSTRALKLSRGLRGWYQMSTKDTGGCSFQTGSVKMTVSPRRVFHRHRLSPSCCPSVAYSWVSGWVVPRPTHPRLAFRPLTPSLPFFSSRGAVSRPGVLGDPLCPRAT